MEQEDIKNMVDILLKRNKKSFGKKVLEGLNTTFKVVISLMFSIYQLALEAYVLYKVYYWFLFNRLNYNITYVTCLGILIVIGIIKQKTKIEKKQDFSWECVFVDGLTLFFIYGALLIVIYVVKLIYVG